MSTFIVSKAFFSPRKKAKRIIGFDGARKLKRKSYRWYQMIGSIPESRQFYDADAAGEAVTPAPIGQVIETAIKYKKFSTDCSARQALA